MRPAATAGLTLATLLWLSGCTALGVSVAGLGGAMIGAGAGAVVKAGTEYQLGGAVARTFTVPLPELHQAALATFERLDIALQHEPDDDPNGLVGRALSWTIRIKFEPVTDVLTRVQVTVSKSPFGKDVATADEILAQLRATTEATAERTPLSAIPPPGCRASGLAPARASEVPLGGARPVPTGD